MHTSPGVATPRLPAEPSKRVLGPQSAQSLPSAQTAVSAPGPPSSHRPSFARLQLLLVQTHGGAAGSIVGRKVGDVVGLVVVVVKVVVMPPIQLFNLSRFPSLQL